MKDSYLFCLQKYVGIHECLRQEGHEKEEGHVSEVTHPFGHEGECEGTPLVAQMTHTMHFEHPNQSRHQVHTQREQHLHFHTEMLPNIRNT